MKISTKGRYALRVMLELSDHDRDEYVPLSVIAKKQEISEKYLESILVVLSKAGAIDALLDDGAQALIFDVRNNGGGYKDELVKILDRLLPEGILFQSKDYSGTKQTDRSDAACIELPMAVLVNQDSYSAAEFFAAALQEYDWAKVVGEKTCGKGNFQTAFTLSDGSMLNLSIGKYYTPQGRSLTDLGVMPDVEIALSDEDGAKLYYGQLEKADDAQLQAAIREITQKLS